MSTLAHAVSSGSDFFTTPSTTSEAPTSDSQTSVGVKKPNEASGSYFPNDNSRRSSISTGSADSEDSVSGKLSRPHTGLNPLDAMSRAYPKPTQEIDVAKQLAMEPRKHSLYHSLRRAATTERALIVDNAETKAKKLAAAKAELLALAAKP